MLWVRLVKYQSAFCMLPRRTHGQYNTDTAIQVLKRCVPSSGHRKHDLHADTAFFHMACYNVQDAKIHHAWRLCNSFQSSTGPAAPCLALYVVLSDARTLSSLFLTATIMVNNIEYLFSPSELLGREERLKTLRKATVELQRRERRRGDQRSMCANFLSV